MPCCSAQGTGGGALALLPADRVVAAQHGWLSPLPPEGASAIVHRDVDHAAEMASAQGVRRRSTCGAAGIVDRVVPERPDAADEPEEFCRRLGRCWRPSWPRSATARPRPAEPGWPARAAQVRPP